MAVKELLREAVDVARRLGCDIEDSSDENEPGIVKWRRNRKHVVLSTSRPEDEQLETIAFALRGEIQLANQPMRPELYEYLDVRRVA